MPGVKEAQEHGVAEAVYANDGFGYKPLLICLCGWNSTNGACVSWEEAGAAFDEHLAEEEADDA